jgi:hypothetical protein
MKVARFADSLPRPPARRLALALGVLHLVFVTEDGLNTMDDPWLEALEAHLREATEETSVRAVLLSARGKVFCAGAHLQGMRTSALLQGMRARHWSDSLLASRRSPNRFWRRCTAKPSAKVRPCCCIAIWLSPQATRSSAFRLSVWRPSRNWVRASFCRARVGRDWQANCCCSETSSIRTRRRGPAS